MNLGISLTIFIVLVTTTYCALENDELHEIGIFHQKHNAYSNF